jgi:hypothetical protein
MSKQFSNLYIRTLKTGIQKTKKAFNYFAALFIITSFTACEKVISIDIDETDKRYVIEGNISNVTSEPAEVKLSQTKNFSDDNNFIGISGATVTIQVNNNSTYTLTEVAQGIYRTSAFAGIPGNTYKLTVSINNQTFTSVSTMPLQLVKLDTITASDFSAPGATRKIVTPSYQDPAGPGNSYRFIQSINGKADKKIFVQNDELSDGRRITRPLVNQDSDIKSGNFIEVKMLCIDANVYKYFYSLDQAATGSNQSSTPANPVSNISGGALGYFSAHSVSSKNTVAP